MTAARGSRLYRPDGAVQAETPGTEVSATVERNGSARPCTIQPEATPRRAAAAVELRL